MVSDAALIHANKQKVIITVDDGDFADWLLDYLPPSDAFTRELRRAIQDAFGAF